MRRSTADRGARPRSRSARNRGTAADLPLRKLPSPDLADPAEDPRWSLGLAAAGLCAAPVRW
ncbi:hypothetical protein OK074_5425 [Actinobacteria bacterium OK074]|nr:hypothetical protein OK074_5425 [Actinobacteria bacterium OK074]